MVDTSFGAIGCEEQGAGDAVPLVFLHGVGSDKSVWRPQLAHFGEARRAVLRAQFSPTRVSDRAIASICLLVSVSERLLETQ